MRGQPVSTHLDLSGTITAGGTAQSLAAANPRRAGLMVQNIHASQPLYVRRGGAAGAGAGSILLNPGAMYETPLGGNSAELWSVFSALTGHPYTASEWVV